MNVFSNILQKTQQWLLCLLVGAIPFPQASIFYVLILAIGLVTVVRIAYHKTYATLLNIRLLPMAVFALYYCILALAGNDLPYIADFVLISSEGLDTPSTEHVLLKYWFLASFPALFLINNNNLSFVKQLFASFSIGTGLVVLASLAQIAATILGCGVWLMPDEFSTLSASNGSFVPLTCTYIDRPYLGIFCVTALIMCYWMYGNVNKKALKITLIVGMLTFVLFPFYVMARLACLCVVMVIGYIALNNISFLKKRWLTLFAILTIVVAGYFVKNEANVIHRFKLLTSDARITTMVCAKSVMNLPSFSFITGFKGVEKERNELLECYKSEQSADPYNPLKKSMILQNLTPHNQFISFLLSGGLIAMLLFLAQLVILVAVTLKKRQYLLTCMLLVLLAFSNVEDLLRRRCGILYYSMCAAVVLIIPSKKEP